MTSVGDQHAHLLADRQHHPRCPLRAGGSRPSLSLLLIWSRGVAGVLMNLIPDSGYCYCHFHCMPVTLSTISDFVLVSSMSITA